jgi:hypothetical protein
MLESFTEEECRQWCLLTETELDQQDNSGDIQSETKSSQSW